MLFAAKVIDNEVSEVSTFEVIPRDWEAVSENTKVGWIRNAAGGFSQAPVINPELDFKLKLASYKAAVNSHIDNQAKALGFDSIITAVTYADEEQDPVNQYRGLALRKWRSACWQKCREILDDWQGGGSEPTKQDVINNLPVFEVE